MNRAFNRHSSCQSVIEVTRETYGEIWSSLIEDIGDQTRDEHYVLGLEGVAICPKEDPSFLEAWLKWLEKKLPQPRVIREGLSAYLSRHYFVGTPHMPDGSWPFDANGDPRPGIVWSKLPLGLYLHHFHRSDADDKLHNHPWKWAIALVLVRGYSEERLGTDGIVRRRLVRPWTLNFITKDTFHRVDLVDGEAWTLFLVGPKYSSWGFLDRKSGEFTPWRKERAIRTPVAEGRA